MQPFADLNQFYISVPKLIDQLRAAGDSIGANRCHTLMTVSWTTGSELLGELDLALTEIATRHTGALRDSVLAHQHFAAHHRRILGLD